MVSDEDIASAVTDPPGDTRAWFRGECVRRYGPPGDVRAASWDSVVMVDERGRLQRVRMDDPAHGTRDEVGALLDRHDRSASLLPELVVEEA